MVNVWRRPGREVAVIGCTTSNGQLTDLNPIELGQLLVKNYEANFPSRVNEACQQMVEQKGWLKITRGDDNKGPGGGYSDFIKI